MNRFDHYYRIYPSIKTPQDFKDACTPKPEDQRFSEGIYLSPRKEINEEHSEITVKIRTKVGGILMTLNGPTYDDSYEGKHHSDLGAFHISRYAFLNKENYGEACYMNDGTTEFVLASLPSEDRIKLNAFLTRFKEMTSEYTQKQGRLSAPIISKLPHSGKSL